MILVTTPTVEGSKTVRVLGSVRGNTVRARHIGNDLPAGLRNMIGGEVGQYSRLLPDAREEAIQRMVPQAEGLEAKVLESQEDRP